MHDREVNEQRERLKAKVKAAIAFQSRPMTIGKADQLRTYEISFTKNGPLGLSLNEEAGRMKVLKVKPQDDVEDGRKQR